MVSQISAMAPRESNIRGLSKARPDIQLDMEMPQRSEGVSQMGASEAARDSPSEKGRK